jgi:hypothetical protein
MSLTTNATNGSVFDLDAELAMERPRRWSPAESGELIQGRVIAVSQARRSYTPKPIPQVTVEDTGGRIWSVLGSSVVLRSKFEEYQPAVGDRIGFRYLGERVSKSTGRTYRMFEVRHRREAK